MKHTLASLEQAYFANLEGGGETDAGQFVRTSLTL